MTSGVSGDRREDHVSARARPSEGRGFAMSSRAEFAELLHHQEDDYWDR
jgi:hypothetical protein